MAKINWNDKASVCDYAKTLVCDTPMVVYKHPNRRNYNITHKSRFDTCGEYKPEWRVLTVLPTRRAKRGE